MSPQEKPVYDKSFIFEYSLRAQFKDHPTLRSVARSQLENYLQYCLAPGSLTLDTIFYRDTRFVLNSEPVPFLNAFIEAFTEGRSLTVADENLIIPVNAEGRATIDLADFHLAQEELCQTLVATLQQQLLDYWQQPADNGMKRWQWLAEVVKDACASNINESLHQSDQDFYYALTGLVIKPEKQYRQIFNEHLRSPAYLLQFTLNNGTNNLSLIYPALLVTNKSGTVLIQPSGAWERFKSESDCIQNIARDLQHRWEFVELSVDRYEPEADIFDELVRVLIDQQLLELESIQIPVNEMFEGAEQLFDQITDPLRLFAGKQPHVYHAENVDKHLPQWLKDADADDRRTYRRYVSAMAATHLEYDGATFFTHLDSIRDFAYRALVDQMSRDGHEPVNPDDMELNIKVARGVPGGWGSVETIRLGIIDFALENLAGLPWGTMTVKGLHQRDVPAWMTPDYVKSLIQSVDIGRTYPAYLKQHLFDNRTEASSRQNLFTVHLRNQLPLQALEAKLTSAHGFDDDGVRLIIALADAGDASQEIVVSPLHLRLGPVLNMFVITAGDRSDAPVILYRPFYSPSLIQFPSRSHLEQAIQSDAPLQKSIHDWYKAVVRHTGLLGANEIRLRWELKNASPLQGDVFQHLYEANSRALVELADRQSVSNAESRWAHFKTLSWLIFESLLPLVTGPVATAGWLVQLAVSLKADLEALSQSDGQDKSFAVADLLLNLAAVLMHAGRITTRSQNAPHLSIEPEVFEYSVESTAPATPDVPVIENRSLPGEQHPQVDLSITENAWATPRSSYSRAHQAILDSFAMEKPVDLGEPVAQGRNKGLYRYNDKWHALVEGQFFRVSIEEGSVLIIDPVDYLRPGPFLISDGQGRWTVDNRMYLKGGAPNKRSHDNSSTEAPGPSRRAIADSSGFPSVIETEIKPLPKQLYHYVNRDKLATIKATRSAFIDNSSNDAYGRPQRDIVGLYVTDLAPDSMPLQQLSETLFGKNRYNISSRANKIHAVLELDPTLYPEGSVRLFKLESPKLTDHIYVLRGSKNDLQLRIKASMFGTGTTSLVSVKEL
ncbi:dermonecrotic toxin domain-containing protein [Pseudomonas sp. NPDC087614]|uniref:dermonecrotic toxin domain-containing protein n=1 Tax=Pseudomonas sp. NPDC087614 TaxID=3364442 RepID=UPI0037F2AFF1